MAKGSERKRSGARRKRTALRPPALPPGTDPEAGPSLAWAKWVDALGGDAPDDAPPATPQAVEERLRAATLAAERARHAREEAHAAAETERARAATERTPAEARSSTRAVRRTMAPPRHDPERAVAPDAPLALYRTPGATLAGALEPAPVHAPAAVPHPLVDEPLPTRYLDDRITLLCRDPQWLHVYWDITPANLERARAALGAAGALVLRVHHFPALAGGERASFDVEVHPDARNWYVHGGLPGHDFEVEIGLKAAGGGFIGLARSNRVRAPLDRMSDVLDEEWRHPVAGDERLHRLSLGAEERREATSGGIQELMARRELGSGGVSSLGRAVTPARRGFWFALDTEIVVYGATEPGASVTCQGRPVSLREDGTFTLRFALPDGHQNIDCAAYSADRSVTITITPAIEKHTAREEQRGEDRDRG